MIRHVFKLILVLPSLCAAQIDSMFVEKNNGAILAFPIATVVDITFSQGTVDVGEQQTISDVLSSFALCQNYPNPFNPSTTIRYSIPMSGKVTVSIFDVLGRFVRSLVSDFQQAGSYLIVWDSRNSSGNLMASGTYFCQVVFGENVLVKKIMLVR
jgi:hypothetical protein